MPIIDQLSNIGEGRKLKELEQLAKLVNTLEPEIEELSDEELAHKTVEFRERLDERRAPRRPPARGVRRPRARPPAARSASATSTSS